MPKVLVVEDDNAVRVALTGVLLDLGYEVHAVSTAAEALREAASGVASLVLLDLTLPDLDGSIALRMIRGVSDVPIIVVTARRDESSVVQLLNAGADDYVTKPFSKEQLAARIGAVLRRTAPSTPPAEILAVGELRIDLAERTASLADRRLELSRREFDLLAYLARNADRVVPRRSLINDVWPDAEHGSDQTIDVHVSWLRRKLGETAAAPRYLHTVRGVGLKLSAPQ